MVKFLQSLRILANDVDYCYINNHLNIEYLKGYSCWGNIVTKGLLKVKNLLCKRV